MVFLGFHLEIDIFGKATKNKIQNICVIILDLKLK